MYAIGAVHLVVALATWIHPTGIGKSLKASQAEHILALFQVRMEANLSGLLTTSIY